MSEFNKFADLMIEAAYQENIKNLGKPMAELMKQSVIQLKPVIEIFFNKGMEIGKAQAVPEWIEYEKQSPRIDGRYQIFINGEQLAADWESPYGFSSAEDGTAFIQELITHWSVLNNDPVIKAQEPAND